MSPIFISVAAFFGVAALVGAVAMLLRGGKESRTEDRLAVLTAVRAGGGKNMLKESGVLSQPLDTTQGALAEFLSRFRNLSLLFEQADTTLTPAKFFAVSAGMGLAGAVAGAATGINPAIIPAFTILAGVLPLLWLVMRRRRRLRKFAKQLPDALELIARALRAGHSLASGFNLVADEMSAPIGVEFQRCYEEQNLGIALDDALRSLTDRVPNLDLKFFATAVILQRQTGGDLAEVLKNIGGMVRARIRLQQHVRAITAEGRLVGRILLGLPVVFFCVLYVINPKYAQVLLNTPEGRWLSATAVLLQVLGMLTIRKIVAVKL